MKKVLSFILSIAFVFITACSEPIYDVNKSSSESKFNNYDDYSSEHISWFIPKNNYYSSDFVYPDNSISSYETPSTSQSDISQSNEENGNKIVYITDTGEKYHRYNCGSLWNSSYAITANEAWKKGYFPCLKCMPPPPDSWNDY